MLQKEGQVRIPAGCAISGIFHKDGTRENGTRIIDSIRTMHDRSNGLGGGFAGVLGMFIGVPVSLISIGGIFGDDPGLDRMGHVWHLSGSKDRMQHLGDVVFPGRWPTAPLSTWGRAKREGRVTKRVIGPMQHDGAKAYFGRRSFGPDGRNYAEITRDAVVEILREPAPSDPVLPAR